MRPLSRSALSTLLLLPLVACGGSGDQSTGAAVDVIGVVGEAGGTIEVTATDNPIYGARVTIPPGAIPPGPPITVTLAHSPSLPSPLPPGHLPGSPLVHIRRDRDGYFLAPVTVTLPTLASAGANSALRALLWDPVDATYYPVASSGSSAEPGRVTFQTSHFSDYALAVAPVSGAAGSVDTGFRVREDAFFVGNFGGPDLLSRLGHCLGMATYAAWYFVTRKPIDGIGLYHKYREPTGEDDFDGDDIVARELINRLWMASAQFNSWLDDIGDQFKSEAEVGQDLLNELALSRHPLVLSFRIPGGGHAVTVYGYDAELRAFQIYDNNDPTEVNTLEWSYDAGFGAYSGSLSTFFGLKPKVTWSTAATLISPTDLRRLCDEAETGFPNSKFRLAITSPSLDPDGQATLPRGPVLIEGHHSGGSGQRLLVDVDGVSIHGSKNSIPIGTDGNFAFTLPESQVPRGQPNHVHLLVTTDPDNPWLAFGGFRTIVLVEPAYGLGGGRDLRAAERVQLASEPGEAALADLNGDGLCDVACSLPQAQSVEVLLAGDTQPAPRIFGIGLEPGPLALADIDGDGDCDMLVAGRTSALIFVYKNDGDAVFSTDLGSTVFDRATTLRLADMDRDGKPDLVYLDATAGALCVRLGAGDGSFPSHAQGSPYATGAGASDLAAADLDEDGALDIAVADGGSGTVTTYRGLGTGEMVKLTTEAVSLAAPRRADRIAVANLRGDYLPEILVTNTDGGAISVLAQDPTSTTLRFLPVQDLAYPFAPQGLVVGRLDGNGTIDIATLDMAQQRVVVSYLSNGATTRVDRTIPAGRDPRWIGSAQIDGDGLLDLAVLHPAQHMLTLLFQSPTSGFEARQDTLVTTANADVSPFNSVMAELDAVAGQDVAVIEQFGNRLLVYLNDGNGALSQPQEFATGTQPLGIAAGDMNGDGKNDLVTANFTNRSVSIFEGNGQGGFTLLASVDVGGDALRVAIENLDNQGPDEIVVLAYNPARIVVLRQNAANASQFDTVDTSGGIGLPHDMALGDVNGDGLTDIAVSQYFSDTVAVCFGDGAGRFTDSPVTYAVSANPIMVLIRDLNEDGKGDVISSGGGGGDIAFGRATGNTWASSKTFDPGMNGFNTGIMAGSDFDGDMHQDIAIPDTGNFIDAARPPSDSVTILYGDGTGGFSRRIRYGVIGAPTAVAVGDLNRDEKPDLIACQGVIGDPPPYRRTFSVLMHR